MGLTNDISDSIAEAFDSDLSDAVTIFTYREISSGSLDTSTGEFSRVYSDVDSRGSVLNLSSKNIKQFGTDATSFKLLVLVAELSKTPKTDDIIIINEIESVVYGIDKDPALVTYSLICKKG